MRLEKPQTIYSMIFKPFFSCFTTPKTVEPNPLFVNYMGAGCVFTDGKHVLAGYQPHKKFPCVSGIGGHKENGETYYQTAYRETVEEIFHVSHVSSQLIETLTRQLPPRREENHKNYIILHYNFQDLKRFLKICKQSGLKSPLYTKFPQTLIQTIRTREIVDGAEISHLCLLPVIRVFEGRQFIHPAFIQDMKEMKEM